MNEMVSRRIAAAVTFLCCACHDSSAEPDVVLPMGNLDAGLDARLDAQSADASPMPDGQQSMSECDSKELTFPIAQTVERAFSAVVQKNDLHVVFYTLACNGFEQPFDPRGLRHVAFTTGGVVREDANVDVLGCTPLRRPTLLATKDAVRLVYDTEDEAGYALNALSLTPASGVSRLHPLPRADSPIAAAQLGPAAMTTVAYVDEPSPSPGVASIVSLQEGYVPAEILGSGAAHHPTRLSLSPLGGSPTGASISAWVSDQPSNAGVYLRLLDDVATGTGAVMTLSTLYGLRSDVAVAPDATGAGVAYVEESGNIHRIGYRHVAADGSLSEAVALTNSSEDVGHVSIAPYRNGFAIAYRRIGTQLVPQSSVRLIFIDPQGHVGATRFIANTTASGTALQLLASSDGRLTVVWDALEDSGRVDDASASIFESRLHVAVQTCH